MSNRFVSTLFKSGEEFEDFLNKLDAFKKGVEDGTIVIPNATKATQDANGNVIHETYAPKSDLEDGSLKAAKAENADSATKATQDANGNAIHETYAPKSDLEDGSLKVAEATKATQDANGNVIHETYAPIESLNDGSIYIRRVRTINDVDFNFFIGTQAAHDALTDSQRENLFAVITDDKTEEEIREEIGEINSRFENYAKTADLQDGTLKVAEATKATQDANGKVIHETYAPKSALEDGSQTVAKAVAANIANALAVSQISFGNGVDVGSHSESTPIHNSTISMTSGLIVFRFSTNTTNLPFFTCTSIINDLTGGKTDCIPLPHQISSNGFIRLEIINSYLYFTPTNIEKGALALKSITLIPFAVN